jgi:hypothetical protein
VSLRDRIIATNDTQSEILNVPEWGLDVEIRGMSGAARANMTQTAADNNGGVDYVRMMPNIVIGCVFDPETGERVFNDDDHEIVMEKSGSALDNIVKVAMRLSGFGDKAVDEAGKDSSSIQSEGSTLN